MELHIPLGDDECRFFKFFKPGKKMFLIRVHGDEHDASSVGRWWINEFGGTFLDIDNDTREVRFYTGEHQVAFDPNRVFSPAGIKETLQKNGTLVRPHIVNAVKNFPQALVQEFMGKDHIIALHNNKEYTIQKYVEGEYAHCAKDVRMAKPQSPQDFILVTKKKDFDALKDCNVVLLSDTPDQEGSLSSFCLKNNLRYFNIETKHGNMQQQKVLLGLISRIL